MIKVFDQFLYPNDVFNCATRRTVKNWIDKLIFTIVEFAYFYLFLSKFIIDIALSFIINNLSLIIIGDIL